MIGVEPGGDDDDPPRRRGAWSRRSAPATCSTATGDAAFVVLLPEQGLDTANLAADRLRRAVEHAASAGTTVSVGIVTTAGTEPEPAALLAPAETAMLRSTQTGGVDGSEARRRARCGCWWPTMTPCRG